MGGTRAGDDEGDGVDDGVDTDNDGVGGLQVQTNGQRSHGCVGCDGVDALYSDGGEDCGAERRLAASALFFFLRFLAPKPPSLLALPFFLPFSCFSLSEYSMYTFRLFSNCLPIEFLLP